METAAHLASPLSRPLLARELLRAISSRPLPGTVLFPLAEMRHPGPGEGKTRFPVFLTQTVSTQCL